MSAVGDHARCWIALGVAGALYDRNRRTSWLVAASTVIATEQLSRLVKRAVPRPRPRLDGLPPLAGVTTPQSFPSSHTATAVAAIYAFDGLLPRSPLVGWAGLTAFSRPYLGVHYPSDVLGGAALGLLVGRLDNFSKRCACRIDD
jgi:undecaprenyl-diphosphatase